MIPSEVEMAAMVNVMCPKCRKVVNAGIIAGTNEKICYKCKTIWEESIGNVYETDFFGILERLCAKVNRLDDQLSHLFGLATERIVKLERILKKISNKVLVVEA